MFVGRLAQLGFTVTQFTNENGHRTHIFLLRKGSPLHIVLLHWSDAGEQCMGGSTFYTFIDELFLYI